MWIDEFQIGLPMGGSPSSEGLAGQQVTSIAASVRPYRFHSLPPNSLWHSLWAALDSASPLVTTCFTVAIAATLGPAPSNASSIEGTKCKAVFFGDERVSFQGIIAHARLLNPEVKLLGLSATPSRGDGRSLRKSFSNIG